jgi:RNA polymerase sigma-70 factor (ECF subfamily)
MTVDQFILEVLPHKHKLYRFAMRMVRDVAEAEDVVQEVMIRLWERREQLAAYRSIEAFAMTITRNLCLDRLKRAGSKTEALDEHHAVRQVRTPYEEMESSDSYRKIRELIDDLPEQQRTIIHLRDVEGYEYSEIAGITGLTENTIRVTLSRARKKIRDEMKKKYRYEFTKN